MWKKKILSPGGSSRVNSAMGQINNDRFDTDPNLPKRPWITSIPSPKASMSGSTTSPAAHSGVMLRSPGALSTMSSLSPGYPASPGRLFDYNNLYINTELQILIYILIPSCKFFDPPGYPASLGR